MDNADLNSIWTLSVLAGVAVLYLAAWIVLTLTGRRAAVSNTVLRLLANGWLAGLLMAALFILLIVLFIVALKASR